MDNLIYWLIGAICLYIIIYNNTNINEAFDSKYKPEIKLVVSRYNESIDWFNSTPFNKFKITCYNKGPKINQEQILDTNRIEIKELPNVGRCDHTYLYYIVENYDNLPDITIFLPGSCLDSDKVDKTKFIIKKTVQTKNTVLLGYNFQTLHIIFMILT